MKTNDITDITLKIFGVNLTGKELCLDGKTYIGTPKTPLVAFDNKTLYLQGVSTSDNSNEFYSPIIETVEKLVNEGKVDTINMAMEKFNTSSAYNFLKLFKTLGNLDKHNLKKLPAIVWFYHNEDLREAGEDYVGLPIMKKVDFKLKQSGGT